MNFRVVDDSDVIVDRNVRMNAHSIAYHDILSDRDMSVDENFFRHARARINYRGGVPVRLEVCARMKNNLRASKSQIRILRAQYCEIGARDFYGLADIDRGRASRRNLVRVFRIGKKSDFDGLALIKPGRAGDF